MNPEVTIVNCTPHAIVLRDENGVDTTFPPSGIKARCASVQEDDFFFRMALGYPVVVNKTGEVEDLPEPVWHTCYIVSSMVAQHPSIAGIRLDVVAPDTGATAIRENGQVVAVRRFQRF